MYLYLSIPPPTPPDRRSGVCTPHPRGGWVVCVFIYEYTYLDDTLCAPTGEREGEGKTRVYHYLFPPAF